MFFCCSTSGTTGRDWSFGLHFYDYSTQFYTVYDTIGLKCKLSQHIADNDTVDYMQLYTNQLISYHIASEYLHHKFVVFRSNGWYYSIEKNTKGIFIQRSKNKSDVVENFVGEGHVPKKRPQVKMDELEFCKLKRTCSVWDILFWVSIHDKLNELYHLLRSNCQHFAKKLFEEFAEGRRKSAENYASESFEQSKPSRRWPSFPRKIVTLFVQSCIHSSYLYRSMGENNKLMHLYGIQMNQYFPAESSNSVATDFDDKNIRIHKKE